MTIPILIAFQKELTPRMGKTLIVAHRTTGVLECSAARREGDEYIDFDGRVLKKVDGWAYLPRHFDDKSRRW